MSVAELEGEGARVAAESGWLALRKPEPALTGEPAEELLAWTAELPGNWRCVPGPDGTIDLFGETPRGWGEDDVQAAREQLRRLTSPPSGHQDLPAEEAVEAALDGAGMAWCRRDAGWAVPATPAVPWELRVQRIPGGVCVEASLVEWDETHPGERGSLARFLMAAQVSLRFARCELGPHGARVVSRAETARLETDVPHSLRAVAAGCCLLVRETQAFTVPDVARGYRDFHEGAASR
jgi:hypothetical protein